MSRYQVGNAHTKEPHPDAPSEGFASATEAAIWAVTHESSALPMWGWWIVDADPQPCRLGGIQ